MKNTPDVPQVDPYAYLYKTGPEGSRQPSQDRQPSPAVAEWPSVAQWMSSFGTAHALMSEAENRAANWPSFFVLAIKQDRLLRSASDETILLCDLETVVRKAAPGQETVGGLLAPDLAMYWIGGRQVSDPRSVAELIAAGARQQIKDLSLSFGIAKYPLLDFKPFQIPGNACKALDHAAFFGPGSVVIFDAVSLNISGDRYYQEGRLDKAVAEYHKALELDPANVNVRNSLGVCYGKQEKYAAALAEFKKALELDPNEVMAVYNIGLIHYIRGAREKAEGSWLAALQLQEDVFEIHFQLGRLYAEQKEWKKGLPHLRRATDLRPGSAPAQCLLGKCRLALDDHAGAIKAFKQAVKRNPNDAEALSTLGWLYHRQGENPEIASTFCRQSVALAPENGLYRQRLAKIYLEDRQVEKALEQFRMATSCGYDCSDQIAALKAGSSANSQGG